MESCATLLSRDLKSNLFNLFASWGGPLTKQLGIVYHAGGTNCVEEGKLQFGALWVSCAIPKLEMNACKNNCHDLYLFGRQCQHYCVAAHASIHIICPKKV